MYIYSPVHKAYCRFKLITLKAELSIVLFHSFPELVSSTTTTHVHTQHQEKAKHSKDFAQRVQVFFSHPIVKV